MGRSGTDEGTLGEVWNGLRDPSRRCRTVRWTLREVWDGLEGHRAGLGRVEGPSGRSGTGRRTLWYVMAG